MIHRKEHKFNIETAIYHSSSVIQRPGRLELMLKALQVVARSYKGSYSCQGWAWSWRDGRDTQRYSLVDALLCPTHTESPFHSQQQQEQKKAHSPSFHPSVFPGPHSVHVAMYWIQCLSNQYYYTIGRLPTEGIPHRMLCSALGYYP